MHSEMGRIRTRVGAVFLQIWVLENLNRLVDYTAGSEVCWHFQKI